LLAEAGCARDHAGDYRAASARWVRRPRALRVAAGLAAHVHRAAPAAHSRGAGGRGRLDPRPRGYLRAARRWVRNEKHVQEGETTWLLRRIRGSCCTRGSASRRTSTPRASTGCAATASTTTPTIRVTTATRSGSTGRCWRA